MPLAATAAPQPASRPIRHRLTAIAPGHLPARPGGCTRSCSAIPGATTTSSPPTCPTCCPAGPTGPPDDWWFIRYRAPEPHLRVRFRLHHPDRYGHAAAALAAWAAALHDTGVLRDLTLATYRPEPAGSATARHYAPPRPSSPPTPPTRSPSCAPALARRPRQPPGTSASRPASWEPRRHPLAGRPRGHGGGAALDRAVLAQARHLHRDPPAGPRASPPPAAARSPPTAPTWTTVTSTPA